MQAPQANLARQLNKSEAKVNLLNFSRHGLEEYFASLGEKRFRATQVFQWIFQRGVNDFDAMSNISKDLRKRLNDVAEIRLPKIVLDQRAEDATHKWVLELDSGNHIETVFIPEKNRGTLCVSSQIGCALACDFCSTAKQGFNRNLSAGEIIAQVWVANKSLGFTPKGERIISNVVLMGMGEPLLNFDNVVTAMDTMMDDFGYGLSKRRVTLSTAGVVPALYRLKEVSDVSLAVSLHAPDDALRDQLVPLNKKYPIEQLLQACRHYVADGGRRKITFEYVMLEGINDSVQHARQLIQLLKDVPAKVNLIPFNPFPNTHYRRSSAQAIETFRAILDAAGLVATMRKTRGDDIDAACGQLVGKVKDRTKRNLLSVTPAQEVGR